MEKFVDLGISVFDDDFTLNPYHYLKDLYPQEDVLGFRSEGINFLFRFDQGRAVIFNKGCTRAGADNADLQAIEAKYAERYPNRAWHFQHSYTHGVPDLKFKAAIGKFVATIAENASFAGAEPVFQQLAGGGLLENYIEGVAKLPMQIFLETCHLPYSTEELNALHDAGCAFLKSLENYFDEELVKDCDAGLLTIRRYMEKHFYQLAPASPINDLINAGRSAGMSDEQLIANIGGMFLTSISNTVGISSAFILRTLINNPAVWKILKQHPDKIRNEHVIMELLRRDNHVKALSRQATEDFQLQQFSIKKGELLYLYFPGINMDPGHWDKPLEVNLDRQFSGENNIIFGGSFYTCIGRKLTMAFLGNMIEGFIRYLPSSAQVLEDQITVDGSWMAERILTRIPIQLS